MNKPRPTQTTAWLACLLFAVALGLFAGVTDAAEPGLHGWVFGQDESGKFIGMVPGAKIEFKNQGGAVVAQTTADEHGHYRVKLSPGQYFYKVAAEGYQDENEGRGVRLRRSEVYHFALTKGKTDPDAKPPELPTVKVGKLQGRVYARTSKGEVGIPRAAIALRKQGTRQLVHVISRDAEGDGQGAGRYEVVLEAGTWHASVLARGFEPLVDPKPIQIEADKVQTRDFELQPYQPETPSNQGIKGVVRAVTLDKTPVALPEVQLPNRLLAGRRSGW